jgi:lipopolysaccharide transport system ATP-binding protein
MSAPAIRIEKLGKRYVVDHELKRRGGYRTLRETLADLAAAPLRRLKGNGRVTHEDFWALKDVSFEVQPGEVVGIIGRNGAGKSTLLKVLSQITKPTTGRVELNGRVGSLLEVGTGFHPELTGRENIYLNGSILGMSKREIDRKFDEIVDFAETEKFLDTPVKRYSSGMYVRLAFAVAAHLEPEMLIIDEVLAVGDARFQRKCLDKMGQVAQEGRTIIFVSHDLGNIVRLCSRAVLLNAGEVEANGDTHSVTSQYVREDSGSTNGFTDLTAHRDRSGNGRAQFRSIKLLQDSEPTSRLVFGSPLTIDLTIDVRESIGPSSIAVVITTGEGAPVHDFWNDDHSWSATAGLHDVSVAIPDVRLYPGSYVINLWMGDLTGDRVDFVKNAATFDVVQTAESGISRPLRQTNGVVYQESSWASRQISAGRV